MRSYIVIEGQQCSLLKLNELAISYLANTRTSRALVDVTTHAISTYYFTTRSRKRHVLTYLAQSYGLILSQYILGHISKTTIIMVLPVSHTVSNQPQWRKGDCPGRLEACKDTKVNRTKVTFARGNLRGLNTFGEVKWSLLDHIPRGLHYVRTMS